MFEQKPLKFAVGSQIVKKKFRFIDPKYFAYGKIIKLSSTSKRFTKTLEKEKKLNEKGVVV